jgi:CTP:molybdopterin cytidylyltransferase MocA
MPKREQIVPIILAAGNSGGLPFPKPLAVFGNKTALQIAVENCAQIGRPVVVLGSDAERIRSKVPRTANVVTNYSWRRGQVTSLRCALERLPRKSAFLIYPVDLPLLKRRTIRHLVRAFHARKATEEIVTPRHKVDGHPVIVSAAVRQEFFKAKTAREVIYHVPGRIRVVAVRTNSIFEDFNNLESYRACLRKFRCE